MPARICPKCQLELDTEEPFCPRDGTRLLSRSVYEQISKETDPLVGQRMAERYLVIRKLGEGGMGDVYLGEHEEIEKRVALKVLKHEYSTRADVVARFKQEAISASRIKHPNVVDVFDFGQLEDGRFFLVMELLEGKDLADMLAHEGVLPPDRGLGIALQMCRALIAAHAKGVVHRDLKPENVFLSKTEDGEETVKLVDFGIAKLRDVSSDGTQEERRKLTKTGMIFGTPEYMAPEQAAGKNVDDKVDVYATGIILFEMFSGRVPFSGDTFMAVLTAHMTDPVPPIREFCPDTRISQQLEQVILKALAKKPSERHSSIAAFAEALLETPEGQADGSFRLSRVATPGDLAPGGRPERMTEDAARANSTPDANRTGSTQLTVSAGVAAPSRNKWVVGGLVGLATVLAVAGVLGYRSQLFASSAGALPTESIAAPTTTEVPPPVSATATAPPAASSALVVVEDPDDSVVIHIETKPAGAVIKKKDGEDLFQICPASPCEYPARPDEKIELVAEKSGMRGSAAVLARTSQTIVIELKRQGGGSTRKPPPPPTGGGTRTNNCEFCIPKGDPDCIKVIRPCDKPPN
jgi:eukaryotic-like serine/threonine-protein kinase